MKELGAKIITGPESSKAPEPRRTHLWGRKWFGLEWYCTKRSALGQTKGYRPGEGFKRLMVGGVGYGQAKTIVPCGSQEVSEG